MTLHFHGLTTNRQGTSYVVGEGNSWLNLSPRDSIRLSTLQPDGFLMKRNATGDVVWARQLGVSWSSFNSVVTDSVGNVFVAGHFTGPLQSDRQDALLLKYDAQGTLQWASRAGSPNSGDNGLALTLARDGRLYLTGIAGSGVFTAGTTVTLPATSSSSNAPFLACFDAASVAQWASRAVVSSGNNSLAVALNSAGTRVIISGSLTIAVAAGARARTFVACFTRQGRIRWLQTGTSDAVVSTASGLPNFGGSPRPRGAILRPATPRSSCRTTCSQARPSRCVKPMA